MSWNKNRILNEFKTIVPFSSLWNVNTTQSIPQDLFICLQKDLTYLYALSAFLLKDLLSGSHSHKNKSLLCLLSGRWTGLIPQLRNTIQPIPLCL